MINTRKQELVKLLEGSHCHTPLTVEKIAGILGVSQRTIRYDLDSIEDELKKRGLSICKQAKKGVWVEQIAKSQSSKTGNWSEYYDYVLSKEERYHAIIVHMLSFAESIETEHLATKLSVSRSTLLADLKNVKELLAERNLRLCSKRGLGLWIEGNESAIRKLLIHIFAARLHNFGVTEISGDDSSYEGILFREYAERLPVKEIAKYFIKFLNENQLPYYDFSINRMVLALCVQLRRLEMEKEIPLNEAKQLRQEPSVVLSQLSKKLADYLVKYHDNFADAQEILFITKQLLSSKIYIFSEENNKQVDAAMANIEAINLAKVFVEYCQVWLGDIYLDDEELIYNLALHLQPAIERSKYGIELTNPLLVQIRQQYSEIFRIALKAAGNIEEKLGIKLSDDEIGYLTIHIGGAIERKKIRSSKRLEVLLVCGNGVGTANLLAIMLKNRMPYINIIKTVSIYELNQMEMDNIDIIVTTIPLKLANIAILQISPILSDAEFSVIENQIQYFYNKKFTTIAKLDMQMNRSIGLCDVLMENTMALDVEAQNWEEAIRLAGQILVDTDAVTNGYVDSMVQCVKDIGPYIVIGKGLAMPHARVEDGVKKICLSMIRLKKPVDFGSSIHDPVDLVFAFGTIDHKLHLKVLSELWQVFSDASAMQMLRQSESKAEILRCIARCVEGIEPVEKSD